MKRQYPFYVLYIDIPPEAVDVNVHPNKSDVRFENNQVVYGCIYSVISSVLDGNASALEFVVGAKDAPAEPEAVPRTASLENIAVPKREETAVDASVAMPEGGSGYMKETPRRQDAFFVPPELRR